MRAVIQRVAEATVTVDGEVVGAIGRGLAVLVGVAAGDGEAEADRLAGRIARLRVFPDEQGRFAHSLLDVGAGVLVVSQFTLLADTSRGNRPSFTAAEAPERAQELYERLCERLAAAGADPVQRGRFGAAMALSLVNDGPVTIIL